MFCDPILTMCVTLADTVPSVTGSRIAEPLGERRWANPSGRISNRVTPHFSWQGPPPLQQHQPNQVTPPETSEDTLGTSQCHVGTGTEKEEAVILQPFLEKTVTRGAIKAAQWNGFVDHDNRRVDDRVKSESKISTVHWWTAVIGNYWCGPEHARKCLDPSIEKKPTKIGFYYGRWKGCCCE